MKKEERKENYLTIIVGLLVVIIIGLLIYLLALKKEFNDYKEENQEIQNSSQEQNNDVVNDEEKITYDCSFTRTYNIVNTLDGYIGETGILSYVVVDEYQSNYAYTHIIPIKLKNGLQNGKKYEFTYTLKGTGIINDMEDIYNAIQATTLYVDDSEHYSTQPNILVTLSVNETDKLGVEQKQESICKTN